MFSHPIPGTRIKHITARHPEPWKFAAAAKLDETSRIPSLSLRSIAYGHLLRPVRVPLLIAELLDGFVVGDERVDHPGADAVLHLLDEGGDLLPAGLRAPSMSLIAREATRRCCSSPEAALSATHRACSTCCADWVER